MEQNKNPERLFKAAAETGKDKLLFIATEENPIETAIWKKRYKRTNNFAAVVTQNVVTVPIEVNVDTVSTKVSLKEIFEAMLLRVAYLRGVGVRKIVDLYVKTKLGAESDPR